MDNQRKNHKVEKVEEDARRTAEQMTEQSRQAFDRAGAATSEAAEGIRASCSKAVKGAQEYHTRVLEFTQVNANRSFEFAQNLLSVKSPTEFFELSADHTRRHWEVLADQAKQITELAQQATLASTEPLRSGFQNAFKRAA
jgi:phasin